MCWTVRTARSQKISRVLACDFINKVLKFEDIKELMRSQQGRDLVIGLMKTEMELDERQTLT
jgi:hypothetical protein